MNKMWRSELELRDALIRMLLEWRPTATRAEIEQDVDAFLKRGDCDEELPEVWKQRWLDDREAQRRER